VFVVLLLLSLYFHFVERSPVLVRGNAVIALMLGAAAALNRWIKLSLHLAFAGFGGLILASVHLGYGLPIFMFIPLLAWSRLALSRHTFPEVIGGFALGLIAATILLWR
jgi:membrane-associated phospholipid phosphatase